MSADGKINRIKVGTEALKLGGVDRVPELDVDAALQDPVDLGLKALAGKAIAGNTVAEHAAEVFTLLENGDLMAHDGEVIRARKTGGAATHNGNLLLCGGCDPRTVVGLHVLGRITLKGEDVHGIINHTAATVHLAGVLAHEAANAGQRVILANELHSIGVAAGLDKRDVARDINVSGATGDARNLLGTLESAAVIPDMMLEVVAEPADGHEGHLARLIADGAIARIVDRLGGPLDELERLVGRVPLEHILQKVVKRSQADAARGALAAALRRAHAHKSRRELDRARSKRTHRQSATQGIVQVVHDRLGVAALHNVKPCHTVSSPHNIAVK